MKLWEITWYVDCQAATPRRSYVLDEKDITVYLIRSYRYCYCSRNGSAGPSTKNNSVCFKWNAQCKMQNMCSTCGKRGHTINKCRFRQMTCYNKFGKRGYLQAVCKEQLKAPVNADKHTIKQLEPVPVQEEEMTICTIIWGHAEGYYMHLTINGASVKMELDIYRGSSFNNIWSIVEEDVRWGSGPWTIQRKATTKVLWTWSHKYKDKPKWKWGMVTKSINYHCCLWQEIRGLQCLAAVGYRVFC